MNKFFVAGNVPSSKNSKVWTGRFLVWSKTAKRYVKETESRWKELASEFQKERIELRQTYPIKVSFKFIRGSKHKFDYVNPLQTVLDLMVWYKWIPDDNADVILPVFEPYEYNRDFPGVVIKIIN